MPSDSLVELVLKSRGWPEDGLRIEEASRKRLDDVCDVMLDAMRIVLRHLDLTFKVGRLYIEFIF